jgi:hypothetical protein
MNVQSDLIYYYLMIDQKIVKILFSIVLLLLLWTKNDLTTNLHNDGIYLMDV